MNFATSGIGTSNYVEINSLTNILNLPVKVLTGYNGNDDQLAMRRGETTGGMGSRSSFEQFVKNGYGRFIAQIGGKEKDIPQLKDAIKDPNGLTFVALIQSQGDIARLTAGPPEFRPTGSTRCATPTRRRWKTRSCRPRPRSSASRSIRPMATTC